MPDFHLGVLSPAADVRKAHPITSVRTHKHIRTYWAWKKRQCAFPNLQSYSGSCVVIDPAGELFATTAAHRERTFNHHIIRLDPFGVCGPGTDRFNPLTAMRADAPDLIEQCRDLANQFVVRSGTEPDPHWNDKAESVIASLLYLIAKCESDPADRHLLTLREMLSSQTLFESSGQLMRRHREDPLLLRQGGQLQWLQDRELGSVMSTVQRHVEWMDSPLVTACLRDSTFDPAALRGGRFTLYLILPHDQMNVLAAQPDLYRQPDPHFHPARGGRKRADSVSDRQSGMARSDQNIGKRRDAARKTGIRLWFFWQSLDQMKECFGQRADMILGNMDTTQWFGVNDNETAEHISKRIGDETRMTQTQTIGGGTSRPTVSAGRDSQGGSVSTSDSINTNMIARRLFKPEEP